MTRPDIIDLGGVKPEEVSIGGIFKHAAPGSCCCLVPGPGMSQVCADALDGKRGGPRCLCRCHEQGKEGRP